MPGKVFNFDGTLAPPGLWRNRVDWPLPWLQVKSELRIFGFEITPSFKSTLDRSWTECFSGFHKVLMSWSSRQLETLVQRVEVLRIFGTSKLWYTRISGRYAPLILAPAQGSTHLHHVLLNNFFSLNY